MTERDYQLAPDTPTERPKNSITATLSSKSEPLSGQAQRVQPGKLFSHLRDVFGIPDPHASKNLASCFWGCLGARKPFLPPSSGPSESFPGDLSCPPGTELSS